MLDVGTMRWVDQKVGNLACTVLAAGKKIAAPFQKPRADVRRIAVMKFFGMGSIVVASPALKALRDVYPGAEIHFVTFRSNKEVLEILGLADRLHFIDKSTPATFAKSTLAVARELRRLDIDLVLDLEFFAKFPLVLSGIAGIPKKAGFYLTQETWRRTLLDVPGSYNHYFHTKDIFLSLIYLLKTGDLYYLDFESFRARYRYPFHTPTEEETAAVARILADRGYGASQRLVVINPNAAPELAPEVRKWPEERYAELAARILDEEPDTFVAFIGAKGEHAYVERIVERVASRRCVNLAGALSLRQLLALFAAASLLVSNDSGPMHLACLVDTPIVGLFFADSPTIFAPIGSRAVSVAPSLYCVPMFTVYTGKDVVTGRPVDAVQNAAARSVPVSAALEPSLRLLREGRFESAAPSVH